MEKHQLVPAAFDPKQADLKENGRIDSREDSSESARELEYIGRIENASEQFRVAVNGRDPDEDEEEEDSEHEQAS